MIKVRAIFKKYDTAKYISHLDLNRCMQRSFKRSGLPVWYSEGFNPHIYIMFALPLSLGFESECEVIDFNMNEQVPFDEITRRMNEVLPNGLEFIKCYAPVMKHTEIAFAEFQIDILSQNPENLKSKFEKFMSQESINVQKRTKKKDFKLIDIKPLCEIKNTRINDGIFEIDAVFSAGNNSNINPSLLIDEFIKQFQPDFSDVKYCRKKIISQNHKDFL